MTRIFATLVFLWDIQRYFYRDGRAYSDFALNRNCATMRFDSFTRNHQPKPCPRNATDIGSAVEGFELAISLIPQLVPRHLVQADQQYRLATMIPSLAADAAACALNLSDPERAVRLLEHGRGVLLAQSLDARTDLTLLRQEDPTLADRFSALRERLNAPENTAVPEPDDDFPAPDRASTWDRRRRAVTDWNDLITEIRAIAGLERFLTPPEFPSRVPSLCSTSAATALTRSS